MTVRAQEEATRILAAMAMQRAVRSDQLRRLSPLGRKHVPPPMRSSHVRQTLRYMTQGTGAGCRHAPSRHAVAFAARQRQSARQISLCGGSRRDLDATPTVASLGINPHRIDVGRCAMQSATKDMPQLK
jgi:hypothetical protein